MKYSKFSKGIIVILSTKYGTYYYFFIILGHICKYKNLRGRNCKLKRMVLISTVENGEIRKKGKESNFSILRASSYGLSRVRFCF